MRRNYDGIGNPIDKDGLYYIQDARTVVGNCALWWRPNGAGYTCDLDDAGKYLGSDLSDRDTDIPWPIAEVEKHVIRHVRTEPLREARDIARHRLASV